MSCTQRLPASRLKFSFFCSTGEGTSGVGSWALAARVAASTPIDSHALRLVIAANPR